ncbi:MAG: hypothetical protein CMH57_11395 [Myxococcales bacterium]|nr:hypothetical protein [Myxococcales bacterium]
MPLGPSLEPLQAPSAPLAPIELTDARQRTPDDNDDITPTDHHNATPSRVVVRKARYVLMGVDCFGAQDGEACQRLTARSSLDVGDSLPLGWRGEGLVERLRRSGNYAYVGISPVFYTDGTAYVTIDVVEQDDHTRLKLLDPPNQTLSFSTNLLELYGEYSNITVDLMQRGVAPKTTPEEGFWQSDHDQLAPYIALFREQVPLHRQELIAIATQEKDPTWRRAASGLLGFDTDDALASRVLAAALLDPNHQVRSEAAHALVPKLRKARDTGEALIDTGSVLRMLQLPSTADRASAISVINELVHIPSLRKPILDEAFPVLEQMLQASRPKASQSAIQVLESATGLSYGRDSLRWKKAIERL